MFHCRCQADKQDILTKWLHLKFRMLLILKKGNVVQDVH